MSIRDKSDKPVVFDFFEIIDKISSKNITPKFDIESSRFERQNGLYPLISDGIYFHEVIVFKGYENNVKIAEREFVIKSDCCHVYLESDRYGRTAYWRL